MFHFIVHASLTEFILWAAAFFVVVGVFIVSLKEKIKTFFSKDKKTRPTDNDDEFERIDKEIKDLQKKMRR